MNNVEVAQNETTLQRLAKEIRTHEETIELLKSNVDTRISDALNEAILCGDKLQEAKKKVGHGNWLDWLEQNTKNKSGEPISERMAQRYMLLSKNATRVSDLASIRKGLAMLTESTTDGSHREPFPLPVQAVDFSKRFANKFLPLIKEGKLPEPNRDEMKTNLEPVVRALWPERFA